nr:MAG TPA: hypothetical protein [Caudoviricetes sp.]
MNCSFWTFCRLTAFFSFLCFAGCFQRSHLPFRAVPGRLFCTLTTREVVTCRMKRISFRSMNERRANRERSPRRAALHPVRPAAANGPCVRRLTTT